MVKEHSRTQAQPAQPALLLATQLCSSVSQLFLQLLGQQNRETNCKGGVRSSVEGTKKVSNGSRKNELGRMQRKSGRRNVRYIPGICLQVFKSKHNNPQALQQVSGPGIKPETNNIHG